jgi:hypothetical protein
MYLDKIVGRRIFLTLSMETLSNWKENQVLMIQLIYNWTFGNGKSSVGRESKVEYEKNGEYEICMKVISGTCTLTKCKSVKVNGNTSNNLWSDHQI